jgi:hypothetical protein
MRWLVRAGIALSIVAATGIVVAILAPWGGWTMGPIGVTTTSAGAPVVFAVAFAGVAVALLTLAWAAVRDASSSIVAALFPVFVILAVVLYTLALMNTHGNDGSIDAPVLWGLKLLGWSLLVGTVGAALVVFGGRDPERV